MLVDGVSQGAIASYTFSNVTADHTIAATFEILKYTITPSAGPHGTITPGTPQIVNYGGSATFTITPDTGYNIVDVLVDGVSQGAIASYTFTNVTADHSIAAVFTTQNFVITPMAGSHGTITPSTPQIVNYGGSVTFTITPDTGYVIDDVKVDGVSNPAAVTAGSYTFSNVTANHTIAATFKVATFVITPTAGAGGTITPGTPQTVNYGGSATFTITPDTGYVIDDVKVDGVSNPAAVTAGSYTFSNVTANHTIAATFAALIPAFPQAFYGTVFVNGQPAPVGASIEARGTNVRIGIPGNPITTSEVGQYGGPTAFDLKLVVQGNLTDGSPIEFYINGVKAECAVPGGPWQSSYPFQSGATTELNLRVP